MNESLEKPDAIGSENVKIQGSEVRSAGIRIPADDKSNTAETRNKKRKLG